MLTYEKLDATCRQIRLLCLQPRKLPWIFRWEWQKRVYRLLWGEPLLNCTIHTVSLDNAPSYSALSYVWGDPSCTKRIVVNDIITYVTENLEIALRHIQKTDDSLTLWVDALCINQADNVEKSWQVQLMRTIYEKATKVIIWLGPSDSGWNSDSVMEKLAQVGEKALATGLGIFRRLQLEDMPKYLPDEESRDKASDFRKTINVGDEKSDIPVFGTYALLQRSWWRRIWVMQELAVANEVEFVCGNMVVPGEHLCAGLNFYAYHRQCSNAASAYDPASPRAEWESPVVLAAFSETPYKLIGRWKKLGADDPTLLELLRIAYSRGNNQQSLTASDTRDLIFALLGLAKDRDELGIVPDYSKSCRTVFIEVARAYLKRGNFEILAMCQGSKQQNNLPSWVPDWSDQLSDSIRPPYQSIPFAASEALQPGPRNDDEDTQHDIFILHGARIDDVFARSEIASCNPFQESFNFTQYLFEGACKLARLKSGIYQTEHDLQDAICRTLIADQELVKEGYWSRASSSTSQIYGFLRALMEGHQFLRESDLEDRATRYASSVEMAADGRRLFISSKGYFGLGPADLRKGDIIVIFLGAELPCVIRKGKKSGFEFVGEVYVHGIMDGEFMKVDREIEQFELGCVEDASEEEDVEDEDVIVNDPLVWHKVGIRW